MQQMKLTSFQLLAHVEHCNAAQHRIEYRQYSLPVLTEIAKGPSLGYQMQHALFTSYTVTVTYDETHISLNCL